MGVVALVLETHVQLPRVASTQVRGEPHHSGRVVRQPDHFIYLGEVLEEPEMDPCNYSEVIQDMDATLWQKAMILRWSPCTPIRSGLW